MVCLLARPLCAAGAPILRAADIRIAIEPDNTCRVTMALTVDGAAALDHRIEARDDTQIELGAVRNARQVQEVRTVGRTQSLILEPSAAPHELAYAVHRDAADDRCPLWLPVAPADGVSRAVRISVALPPGASPRGTMPAFAWSGSTGTTTLGHIPAFVRVAYAATTQAAAWDITTAMDAMALAVFAGASGIWVWRRRR